MRIRSLLVLLAAVPAATLLSACGPKVAASTTSTEVPTLVWHFYNPLTTLPTGWETDWKSSPQKVNTSKALLVAGTGLSSGGMRSSKVTARMVYGECTAEVDSWLWSSGGGDSVVITSAVDEPKVVDGQADYGAGAVISLSAAQVSTWFASTRPCSVWVNNVKTPGTRLATAIIYDATVTSLSNRTRSGSFAATRW